MEKRKSFFCSIKQQIERVEFKTMKNKKLERVSCKLRTEKLSFAPITTEQLDLPLLPTCDADLMLTDRLEHHVRREVILAFRKMPSRLMYRIPFPQHK